MEVEQTLETSHVYDYKHGMENPI